MKVSIAAEAENELIEGARFYAQQSNAELGFAFIAEFERSVELLRVQPKLGAPWRGESPHAAAPLSIQHRLLAAS